MYICVTFLQKAVVDAYKRLYISPIMPGNSANAIRYPFSVSHC